VLPSLWIRQWRGEGDELEDDEDNGVAPRMPLVEIPIIVCFAVFVELCLKGNHISGVHSLSSPGQFMPFFIALAQLLTTLYRLGKYWAIMTVDYDNGGEEEGKSP
jgi:hypothetical protein